jgi:phosphoglycolate phosphatase
MFTAIRAVLFDFDGTLVEQHIDFALMRRAVLQLAVRYGLDAAPLASMYALELVAHAEHLLGDGAGGRGRAFAAEAQQAILDIELEAAAEARPFPGVRDLLGRLPPLRVAIVTRNCRAAVELVLSRHHFPYDVLLTRDDTPHVKPDPRHLLAALQLVGVPGEQAVMCGDHPMDVLVGKRVGARTVGVLPAGAAPDYFADAHPDLIVHSVAELGPYLLPAASPPCRVDTPPRSA